MNIEKVFKLAREYFPGLRSKSFPIFLSLIVKIIAYLSLFIGLSFSIISFMLPVSGILKIEEPAILEALKKLSLGSLMLGASLIFSSILGKSFYRSYYYRGLEQVLLDDKINSSSTSFEVAEIFFNFKNDLVHSFLNSSYGKEILIRMELGADFYQYALSNIHSDDKNIVFPENTKINLELLSLTIINQVPDLSQSFFQFGKTNEEFIESAKWVEEMIQRRKEKQRTWGRKTLSKISSIGKDWSYGYTKLVEKFTEPISSFPDYRNFDLENIAGKEETEQLISILSKEKEANAMIISETMSSQLDTLYRLGKQIEKGDVPRQLESKKIIVLDGNILVSNTGNKKDFESLFLSVLNESTMAGNVLLVLDKLPSFIESAYSIGSNVIALLDPYINTNRLQLIALSSMTLYYEILEKNSTIMERFGIIQIQDADLDKTIKIVKELAELEERRYGIYVTYPAINEIVDGSDRYITQGIMPDKAVDLLLEIVPYGKQKGIKFITKEFVQSVITNKTGVRLGNIDEKEASVLMNLENALKSRVVGQEEAVERISSTIRRSRSGIQNPKRPIGSFLFLGPTGVGKTEVSKALASVFFNNEDAMSRFDMSEYTTFDAVEKLIGSFKTGQPGALVTSLKKNPYGLILLDEFEKASPPVKDLFLQILDEGMFSDMQGKKINARNTIIIATSNAGATTIWSLFEKGQDLNQNRDLLIDEIISEQSFKPELLNRFDDVVIFHPLDKDKLEKITKLMLQKLQKRIYQQKRVQLNFSPAVISLIANQGINPQFGARPMNRYIQDNIERAIANKIVTGLIKPGMNIVIEEDDLI